MELEKQNVEGKYYCFSKNSCKQSLRCWIPGDGWSSRFGVKGIWAWIFSTEPFLLVVIVGGGKELRNLQENSSQDVWRRSHGPCGGNGWPPKTSVYIPYIKTLFQNLLAHFYRWISRAVVFHDSPSFIMPKSFSMGYNYLTVLEEVLLNITVRNISINSVFNVLGIPSWVHVSSVALRLTLKLTSVGPAECYKGQGRGVDLMLLRSLWWGGSFRILFTMFLTSGFVQ